MKEVSPKYKPPKFTHNLTYNKRISSHHANYTNFLKRQQKKSINSKQTPLRAKDLVYDEPYFHCFQEALFPSLYIPLVGKIFKSTIFCTGFCLQKKEVKLKKNEDEKKSAFATSMV